MKKLLDGKTLEKEAKLWADTKSAMSREEVKVCRK